MGRLYTAMKIFAASALLGLTAGRSMYQLSEMDAMDWEINQPAHGMYGMGTDSMEMNHDMANWEFDMEMDMSMNHQMPSFEQWKSQQAQQESYKKMMKQWMEANMDFDLESDCEHEEERKMVEMM